jgi:hypothetical protein
VNGSAQTGSPTVVNLTATSPGCSNTGGTLVSCTVVVPAPVGSDVFSMTTYSQPNAAGNALSSASMISVTVASGVTNNVPLTLNPIVASVVVTAPSFINGVAATAPVMVTAKDATGATIVAPGSYQPAIALTNSDTSGSTTLSTTNVPTPNTVVTLSYNGSSSAPASVTISATATGIPSSAITPATVAISHAAGPTGSNAILALSDSSNNTVAIVGAYTGITAIVLTKAGVVQSGIAGSTQLSAVNFSPGADACAVDPAHAQLYCISYSSPVMTILSYSSSNVLAPPTVVGQTMTDAPSNGFEVTGGTCVICGIAYDPTDAGVIIATSNGYEVYGTSPGATAPIKTVAATPAENFGYNVTTNQVFSPYYSFFATTPAQAQGLDVIDMTKGIRYVLSPPIANLDLPDQGAVDISTGLGVAPEEESYPIYLDPIPAPGSSAFSSGGTYTSNVAQVTPANGPTGPAGDCELSGVSIDSASHLAFFAAEFCTPNIVAVAQLPALASATPNFLNYVVATLPNTPAGSFSGAGDPHALTVANISGMCAPCGLVYNYPRTYLAVIDLTKLAALASPANPAGYNVPSTTDLTTPNIVRYFATGSASSPSSLARSAYATHRKKL